MSTLFQFRRTPEQSVTRTNVTTNICGRCFYFFLPHLKTHVNGDINPLNFHRPIVTQEFIEKEDRRDNKHLLVLSYIRWGAVIFIAIFAGLLGSLQILTLDTMYYYNREFLRYLDKLSHPYNDIYLVSYTVGCNVIFTLIVTVVAVYTQPRVEGTGIEDIISFLNGIDMPQFGDFRLIITKYVCIFLSAFACLPAGREEPFIHVISMLGVFITNVRIPFTEIYPFLNDVTQRDFAAVACGAATAASFGTPIGGTLFALELLTHWSVNITFYIFLSSLCAGWILKLMVLYYNGQTGTSLFERNTYLFRLDKNLLSYSYGELPVYALMGVCIGICGAVRNYIFIYVNAIRKRLITTNLLRVIEAISFVIIISIAVNFTYLHRKSCIPPFDEYRKQKSESCTNSRNNLLTFLSSDHHSYVNCFIVLEEEYLDSVWITFFGLFFSSAALQLGMYLPTGVISCTLVNGAIMGRLFTKFLRYLFPKSTWFNLTKLSILGGIAHTSAVTHLKFSLGVMVLESFGDPAFALPIFLIIFVTNWVVKSFNFPIYQLLIRVKGIPYLDLENVPVLTPYTAEQVMTQNIVCIPVQISYMKLFETVFRYRHLGFPVVSSNDVVIAKIGSKTKVIGLIYRRDIFKLLNPSEKHKLVRDRSASISPALDPDQLISLERWMDPYPLMVRKTTSFTRTYHLFYTLGLQFLFVVDHQNYLIGVIGRRNLSSFKYDIIFCKSHLTKVKIDTEEHI